MKLKGGHQKLQKTDNPKSSFQIRILCHPIFIQGSEFTSNDNNSSSQEKIVPVYSDGWQPDLLQ